MAAEISAIWSTWSGAHCIQVTAGGVELAGSPFVCEVYDVDHVYVIMPRQAAVVGQLYEFQGSLSVTSLPH